MISNTPPAWRVRAVALVLAAAALTALAGPFLASPALARDGISECSIAETNGESGHIWRYTINLQVPQGGHCRVYVIDDLDRKTWKYCWLKGEADNPVSATCDDTIDDSDFDLWRAKAVCGSQNFMAFCHREMPLQPSR